MSQRLLPMWTLSLIGLFLLFAPVSQVRADSGVTHTRVTVDGYDAELVLPNGPAMIGPNPVIIRLFNTDHRPLAHATVLIAPNAVAATDAGHSHSSGGGHDAAGAQGHTDAVTSGHNASPADGHAHQAGEAHIDTIMTQLEAGADAGNYTGVIHFDSAGAWQVQLQFTDAGVDRAASFAVTVAEPARDWRILSAFGGANALIIMTAGVLKRRSTAAKRIGTAVAANLEN
jgi:hypothetical protein